jgi:hypothetical protein
MLLSALSAAERSMMATDNLAADTIDSVAVDELQLARLRRLTERWRFGRWLRTGDEPVADQFTKLSVKPLFFFWCEIIGRFVHAATVPIFWVWGWKIAGASWLRVTPGLVFFASSLVDIFMEYVLGPVNYGGSWTARAILVLHLLNFSYISILPLFLVRPPHVSLPVRCLQNIVVYLVYFALMFRSK